MSILSILIPVTLLMGLAGLAAFFWSLRAGQYEDLSGDGERILFDASDTPLRPGKDIRRDPCTDPAAKETTT